MNILKTLKLLELIRKEVDGEMSLQKLQVLLTALANPTGIDQSTLLKRVDQSRAAVSKNVADLSLLTSKKEVGVGLIRSDADPMNLSTRIITPTAKGIKLAKEFEKLLS